MLSLFVRHFSIASQEYRIIHRVELAKLRANEDKLHFSAFFFFFTFTDIILMGKTELTTPPGFVFFFFFFSNLPSACLRLVRSQVLQVCVQLVISEQYQPEAYLHIKLL